MEFIQNTFLNFLKFLH